MSAPLAVTGWSAVSALGIGAGTFSDGIIAGRTAGQGAERDDTAPAPGLEGSVPGFDIRRLLGRKNTRAMDRITGLTVLTVGRLLDAEQAAGHEFSGHETGFVLGTTTGSVQSMMDFSRDSFIQDRPYLVDPARFPSWVPQLIGFLVHVPGWKGRSGAGRVLTIARMPRYTPVHGSADESSC